VEAFIMTQGSVYRAASAVSAAFAEHGIGKTRQNEQQRYKFRGIDEVMNALAPLLVEHGLLIVPRMVERSSEERQTKSGNAMFTVTVAAEFDFVSVEDGSAFTARTYGEAMDTGDKATNKAMAVAYKYAAFQTFCIPTEGGGDTDADAVTHEEVKPKSAYQARKDGDDKAYREVETHLRLAGSNSIEKLAEVWAANQFKIRTWPPGWQEKIAQEKDRLKGMIEQQAKPKGKAKAKEAVA